MGSGTPFFHCFTALGQWKSFYTVPHCRGAVGGGTPLAHCLNALGQWAVDLLRCAATLLGSTLLGSTLLGSWGAVGIGLLQGIATLPGSSGQWDFFMAMPHCRGAMLWSSETPSMHCDTAGEQWAEGLLQGSATLRGRAGSKTPAVHYHTAGEHWAGGVVWCGVAWCGVA